MDSFTMNTKANEIFQYFIQDEEKSKTYFREQSFKNFPARGK